MIWITLLLVTFLVLGLSTRPSVPARHAIVLLVSGMMLGIVFASFGGSG